MYEDYYREMASAGALFLDERVPLWFVDVDLDTLHLGSCTECVLGQLAGQIDESANYNTVVDHTRYNVFGDRVAVLAKLGLTEPITPKQSHELGFSLPFLLGDPGTYGELTGAWRQEIGVRRDRYLSA